MTFGIWPKVIFEKRDKMELNNYMNNIKDIDISKYSAKSNPPETLQEHTENVKKELELLKKLNYIPSEHIYELTKVACHYHDYGKMNPEFQKRIRTIGKKRKFDSSKEVPHNILSIYFLNKELLGEDYYKVAYSVMRHHSSYIDYDEEIMIEQPELIEELLAEFLEKITLNMRRKTLNKIIKMQMDYETIWIKGLLHRCDYSASAGLLVEYENNFLEEKMEQYMNGWKKNELQLFCQANTNSNIIVKAQTGMGKTEAGLLWLGNWKGFFVLPLKVAINAIYDRIRNNILKDEKIQERVGLLHSDMISCYLDRAEIVEEEITTKEYADRTKQLSMPITIATLDQLFDFVFKCGGYEMKLVTLAYSKIIIDEIQMYSPDLLAYLIYGISKINEFGGKIAVLTATLAPFIRDMLVEKAFLGDVIESDKPFVEEDKARHWVKVSEGELGVEWIIEKYQENKEAGKSNKILVVCNTVKKAQEIYEELREFVNEKELFLLHKKFIEKERVEKEQAILKFGKTYAEDGKIDKKSGIWIVTSIVEASLDIDFDILFTELQDLNSLFQRMGRCNRKCVKDIEEYNCYVYLKISEKLIRNGKKGFIDRKIYELSKEALKNFDGVFTEKKKMELIDGYFTMKQVKTSDFINEYEETYQMISEAVNDEFDKNNAKLRDIVSYIVIPKSVYENNQEEIAECLTRLTEENITYESRVKLLQQINKFTLSVEPYIYNTKPSVIYIKNIFENKKYTPISVIDCIYDEMGFRKMEGAGYEIW